MSKAKSEELRKDIGALIDAVPMLMRYAYFKDAKRLIEIIQEMDKQIE